MSIATLASLRAKQAAPSRIVHANYSRIATGVTNNPGSHWLLAGTGAFSVGVAPTTAAVPADTTPGSLLQNQRFSDLTNARIVRVDGCMFGNSNVNSGGMVWLCDRLSHQGGLSGTALGAQTTNLPTAAIPARDPDTSGKGVLAMVEGYTAVGATPQTFTVSYTNSAGTPGRTSEATQWYNAYANQVAFIPLQQGDQGFRSIESFTWSGSTGIVGNFGITLFRPLVQIPIFAPVFSWDPVIDGGGVLPIVPATACLWPIVLGDSASGEVCVSLEIRIAED